MKQTEFWISIFKPLEIGWWIEWALATYILLDPKSAHSVITPNGIPICGSVPNDWNGKSKVYISKQIGNGTLLHSL